MAGIERSVAHRERGSSGVLPLPLRGPIVPSHKRMGRMGIRFIRMAYVCEKSKNRFQFGGNFFFFFYMGIFFVLGHFL